MRIEWLFKTLGIVFFSIFSMIEGVLSLIFTVSITLFAALVIFPVWKVYEKIHLDREKNRGQWRFFSRDIWGNHQRLLFWDRRKVNKNIDRKNNSIVKCCCVYKTVLGFIGVLRVSKNDKNFILRLEGESQSEVLNKLKLKINEIVNKKELGSFEKEGHDSCAECVKQSCPLNWKHLSEEVEEGVSELV